MSKKRKVIIAISVIMVVLILIVALLVFFHIIPEYRKQLEREQALKNYRQEKIDLYIQENNRYDDYEVDVAFLGDSLTDGYNVEQFYPQFKVANRGISGDTTFDLEERLQVSVYDLKPKIAVMLIGANNFKTMFENYERIVAGL